MVGRCAEGSNRHVWVLSEQTVGDLDERPRERRATTVEDLAGASGLVTLSATRQQADEPELHLGVLVDVVVAGEVHAPAEVLERFILTAPSQCEIAGDPRSGNLALRLGFVGQDRVRSRKGGRRGIDIASPEEDPREDRVPLPHERQVTGSLSVEDSVPVHPLGLFELTEIQRDLAEGSFDPAHPSGTLALAGELQTLETDGPRPLEVGPVVGERRGEVVVDPLEVDRVADFLRQTKGLFHRGERLLRMTGLRKFDPEVLHRGSPHLERADPRGHLDRTPEVRIRLLRVATPPVELSEHPQGPCELRGLAERLESRPGLPCHDLVGTGATPTRTRPILHPGRHRPGRTARAPAGKPAPSPPWVQFPMRPG